MGTWDSGFFDNDMACNWENSISKNRNLLFIENALKPVIKNNDTDDLDIDIANKGLAAAEAVARLKLKDGERTTYTTHLDMWADNFNQEIPQSLIDLSITVINIVLSSNSELKQYWSLRGEHEKWFKKVNKLKERLNS